MLGTIRDEIQDLLALVRNLVILTALAAVYKELRTPPAQRTWHGRLFGAIPYDFRLPDIGRLREAYWNTESDVVFTDRPLGVGWAVNIPVAARKVSEIVSQYADSSAALRRRVSRRDEPPALPDEP